LVGIQDVERVTPKQMAWLRKGGRNFLYKLFKEMEEKLRSLGLLGDFSGTIWLPTDIIVHAESEDGGGVFWTYDEDMLAEAKEFSEELKEMNPHAKVSVVKASEFLGIKDGNIMTEFTWHGHGGAAIIFRMLDQIFDAVEEGGDVTRIENAVRIGEKFVRLPFFVPKTDDEKKVLEFAGKYCGKGSYLIFPDKRVFKCSRGNLEEATPEDIVKLALNI